MDHIKILFFDIDGTLVDPATGRIPAKTVEALNRLHDRGMLLCIATGRPTASLPDFGQLQFDAFCTFNGSLCYCGRQIIHSNPIDPADVRTVVKNATDMGRPVSIAVRDRLAANGWDTDLADYYQLAGLQLQVSPDFDSVLKEDVYQIMLGCKRSDHSAIIQNTKHVTITFSWDRAADVIPATSGKAQGIFKILEHFHLDRSQALAFGDGHNDIDMLKSAGIGVAMGNAPYQVKALADHVCGHVSEDGIYHYCIRHNLI